jgi:chemotaxis protein histidine kinase CheA
MTDNSLLEDFADETREHLEELESSLLRLESDPADRELLNTIFRSMHTIKGASEYLGFERIARDCPIGWRIFWTFFARAVWRWTRSRWIF